MTYEQLLWTIIIVLELYSNYIMFQTTNSRSSEVQSECIWWLVLRANSRSSFALFIRLLRPKHHPLSNRLINANKWFIIFNCIILHLFVSCLHILHYVFASCTPSQTKAIQSLNFDVWAPWSRCSSCFCNFLITRPYRPKL